MAMHYAHGLVQWLSADANGTNYVVTGLGFQPKAMMFVRGASTSATDAAGTGDLQKSIGVATAIDQRRCSTVISVNGQTQSTTAGVVFNDCVLGGISSTAVNAKLDLTAIGSDGFTLTVDDQSPVNVMVFWQAWGGTDITVAAVADIVEPGATGTQDITVTGFTSGATDQALIVVASSTTDTFGTITTTADSRMGLGFATGTTDATNIMVTGQSDDSSGITDTDGAGKPGMCLGTIASVGGSVASRAKVTAWGTDLFTLTWAAREQARRHFALAIKGGSWAAGSYTIDGSTLNATATVSGLSFTPGGVMIIGRRSTETASGSTSSVEDRMSVGFGSSTSSRRATGYWDEDALETTDINLCNEYDQILAFPDSAGALGSAYDLNAINADGFQIIVDTAGGVASEWQGYLAWNSTAPAGGGALSVTLVDSDNEIYSAQADFEVKGAGFSAGQTFTISGVACTELSFSSSTSVKLTAPNAISNNIKFGKREFKVSD